MINTLKLNNGIFMFCSNFVILRYGILIFFRYLQLIGVLMVKELQVVGKIKFSKCKKCFQNPFFEKILVKNFCLMDKEALFRNKYF